MFESSIVRMCGLGLNPSRHFFGAFMEFHCWKKDGEIVFSTPSIVEKMRSENQIDATFKWQYAIHADSLEEAVDLHKIIMNSRESDGS